MQTIQEIRTMTEIDLELLEYITVCVRADPKSAITSWIHWRLLADLIAKYGTELVGESVNLINEREIK